MIQCIVGHRYIPCPLRRNRSGKSPLRPRSVWQGRYAEAEPFARRALELAEREFGASHPTTTTTLHWLAVLYKAQGRYAEAEPLHKRSLAIREKALGPEHPHVATSLENYANLLRATGRTAEADKMEARAKAIRDKLAKENI